MLKRVRITDPGDSEFLLGEHVEKMIFEDTNQQLMAEDNGPQLRNLFFSVLPRLR
jgi:DNA-directed RNA polymerase subunit beta'